MHGFQFEAHLFSLFFRFESKKYLFASGMKAGVKKLQKEKSEQLRYFQAIFSLHPYTAEFLKWRRVSDTVDKRN